MLGLTIAAVQAGNGRHFSVLTDEQRSGAILYTLAGFPPGIFSFGIPKLAVVALLTRITNPSRKHRIFLWAMTGGYDTADITIWTSIEGNSIIIGACIPTLQPLFDRIFGRGIFGSSRGEQGPSGYRSRSRSGVKLATIGSKTLRSAKQHGKSGVSETTLGHDSQDSILSPGFRNGSEESKVEPSSGITRTQHLTVEYEDVTEQTRPSYSPCDTRR
ncbi:hypothetical protein J4E80_005010 [Alternaria sp. BMP 0032]|nr:hypothetical protein J4E80_005010 [Alternaria sp. BMP 0032]